MSTSPRAQQEAAAEVPNACKGTRPSEIGSRAIGAAPQRQTSKVVVRRPVSPDSKMARVKLSTEAHAVEVPWRTSAARHTGAPQCERASIAWAATKARASRARRRSEGPVRPVCWPRRRIDAAGERVAATAAWAASEGARAGSRATPSQPCASVPGAVAPPPRPLSMNDGDQLRQRLGA